MKEFDESKHPRDETGKFTEGVGTEAEQKRVEELTKRGENDKIDNRKREVFGGAKHKEYLDALVTAKKTLSPKIAWRVDDYGGSIEEFKVSHQNATLHITAGGSTVAVEKNGDIIAVCKNDNDTVSGSSLIQQAVANGGTKLDSYAGNHKFYCKNGFEPVSWCAFNEEYAPHDWDKNRDKPEPIIFYRYTGKKSTESAEEFYVRVPASEDYDTAMEMRDNKMEEER